MRKKAQEEMVGFVLIMVVVSVIFLILLSLFFATKKDVVHSEEVSQFLNSIGKVTTECSINDYDYETIQELFEYCERNRPCRSGNSCKILENTLTELIQTSWLFSPDGKEKGYELRAYYEVGDEEQEFDDFSPLIGGVLETEHCKGILKGDELLFDD